MSLSVRPFVIGELDLDAITKPVLAGFHYDVVFAEATLDLDLRSAHATHLHAPRVDAPLIGEVDENSRHVGARGRVGCNINDANHTGVTVGFATKPDALPQMKYGVLVTGN